MGLLDNLSNIASQLASGNASAADVHSTYDQVARAVPQGELADGLSEAFRSDQTPPFEQMVTGLFNQSSPDQKAGLLNQLLAALGSAGAAQVLASKGGLGGLAGMLSGGRVTPQQASRFRPRPSKSWRSRRRRRPVDHRPGRRLLRAAPDHGEGHRRRRPGPPHVQDLEAVSPRPARRASPE
jgi:hypothetical protein